MADRFSLSEATIAAAWNVQGDPQSAAFMSGIQLAFEIALPITPNTVSRANAGAALWLGPRSWLVVGAQTLTVRDPFAAGGGAIFDVSASRSACTLRGAAAASIIAKHCPLDFDTSRFAPGTCAQSLFGSVNALYYRHLGVSGFTLFVARSFAHGVRQHLQHSLAPYGYDAAASTPFVAD